jgi:predicted ATPase/DNA-binding SARP family transcriptional activator
LTTLDEYLWLVVDGTISIRVLGPVEVIRNGAPINLGGKRQQALLALLALDTGKSVPADRLIDELWPGQPPPGTSTLPSYVTRLRAALGRQDAIVAEASGYRLAAADHQVDAHAFETLLRAGRTAMARGRARRARDRLDAALSLWRGRALADVAVGGVLQMEATRLEELRLLAIEERIEADLALGVSVPLVDELESLVREHPYRENFWHQLMVALYRADRQADALDAYRRAYEVLDAELGLDPSPALQQLQLQILRQEVPIARPPGARHNLPASLTSFIGRSRERADIEELLDDVRLITLTGVGGVGKTRLALEVAANAIADVPDGVVFADLSSVGDPSLVGPHLAWALGQVDLAEADTANALTDRLKDKRVLLVLDNCEHVGPAVGELAERLLRASPGLTIVATSREAIGVPGEVDYPVPPMALAPADASLEEIRASDAVMLFMDRAREVRPHLADDAETASTASRICNDLDGLPLAIELAAARAKALSLADIASRLSDRFRFLVSWRRLSAARHRTLREAMDWSFDLLAIEDQEFLARLSVFAGTFTLPAAVQVCAAGDEERAVAALERLVAASLVVADERDGEMRYRLLETVRQYAAERLKGDVEDEVRRAHARFFLRLAERADLTAVRRGSGQRLDLAVTAQDNLRRALAWGVESGPTSFGLELATSLERFWATHDPSEGMRWFGALFDRPDIADVPPVVRANALRAYGGACDMAGDDAAAERYWGESLAIFRELGDEAGQAVLLHRLAISAQRRGDLVQASRLVAQSHEIHERLGSRWGQAQTLGTMGAIARDSGDQARAYDLFLSSLDLAQSARVTWWVSGTLAELANLDIELGRIERADARARESLTLADQMGDRAGRLFGVGLMARIAAELGQFTLANDLWTAVADEDAGAPLGGWRRHREEYRAQLEARLSSNARPAEMTSLTLEEAVALALGRPTT